MLMRRKEVKDYGTKKAIEGAFERGQRCMIIEDLVTSGMSVMETVEPLEKEGLVVQDVVVLIDREQGGKARLASKGLALYSAFTLSYILEVLVAHGHVSEDMAEKVRRFIAENQTDKGPVPAEVETKAAAAAATAAAAAGEQQTKRYVLFWLILPLRILLLLLLYRSRYEERARVAQNPMAQRLFELMARKQTNLSVAADVETADEMLALADAVGPYVCVLKTHVDVFSTWTEDHAAKLRALADTHGTFSSSYIYCTI